MKLLLSKPFTISDEDTGQTKDLVLKRYRLPNGILETFFVDKGRDSVQVVAVTKDGKFITVSQHRPNNGQPHVELPGGSIDEGEEAHEAAARELLEETAYASQEPPTHLVTQEYSPYSTGSRHSFLIRDCEKVGKQDLDPTEFVQVKRWDKASFMDLVETGKMRGYEAVLLALHKKLI